MSDNIYSFDRLSLSGSIPESVELTTRTTYADDSNTRTLLQPTNQEP